MSACLAEYLFEHNWLVTSQYLPRTVTGCEQQHCTYFVCIPAPLIDKKSLSITSRLMDLTEYQSRSRSKLTVWKLDISMRLFLGTSTPPLSLQWNAIGRWGIRTSSSTVGSQTCDELETQLGHWGSKGNQKKNGLKNSSTKNLDFFKLTLEKEITFMNTIITCTICNWYPANICWTDNVKAIFSA